MKRVTILLLFLISISNLKAQYTEVINSKRPGFTESPYGVGTDVFQVEGGFFYKKSDKDDVAFTYPKTYGTNVFLRYGKFIENLEVNANITYQKDDVRFHNVFTSEYTISGISELTIGAKYLIYNQKYTDNSKEIRSWRKRTAFDRKRLIPSVGVYVGLNTNFVGIDYKEEGISPKAAILLQNDFSQKLILVTNLVADKISQKNQSYSYVISMTYNIDDYWSYFIENKGIFSKNYENEMNFGTGIAYLYSRNLQFDLSARTSFEDYSNFYASFGASWRMDRHQDKEIIPDKNKVSKGKKRGNFLTNLFKKKRKRRRK